MQAEVLVQVGLLCLFCAYAHYVSIKDVKCHARLAECTAVERIPGKVSGEWLFKGTRVPVRALFENLESGARIDDFLAWFPGVARDQVEAVLKHAEHSLAVV